MENNYSTIGDLMEFGMGLAVAQQMIRTMNNCVSNLQSCNIPNTRNYYAIINNKQAGPLTEKNVKDYIKAGIISQYSLVWFFGLKGWSMALNVPEINKLFESE